MKATPAGEVRLNRFRLYGGAGILLAAFLLLGAPGWAEGLGPYPSLEEIYAELHEMAAARPDLIELEEIGRSVEGRPIYGVKVARKDGKARPEALYLANIHAGEVISAQVALGTLRRLTGDDGRDPRITSLLDQTGIYVVPLVNPDGYQRVISTGGEGGELGARKNAHGVDLNRNFPVVPGAKSHHPLAGNKRPRSSYYMGEYPLSEPETQAIAALVKRRHFYVSFMGHSVAGKVLYPHCFANVPPRHESEMLAIGQAFVAHQERWKYKVQQSYSWYPTLGDSDDFLYIYHGILAFTIEHGTIRHNLKYAVRHHSFFWLMNPGDPAAWVENDSPAVLAAIEAALRITGGRAYDPQDCQPPPKRSRWPAKADINSTQN